MPPAIKTPEVSKEPVKLLIRTQAFIQRITKNIRRYTKCIDWKNSLQKIENKLKRIMNPRPQITA